MSEPEYTDFRPRWAREGLERYAALADTPNTGTEPDVRPAPRLPTRILPRDGQSRLTAATLSDVLSTTQRILNFASYEAVYGPSPDFTDLRTADAQVLRLAKLSIEPFDEGSFVILGELAEADLEIDSGEEPRRVSARNVLERFTALMSDFSAPAAQVRSAASIGAIQAIEELGKVLNREARLIEYRPFLPGQGEQGPAAIVVDRGFVERVSAARRAREESRESGEPIEGTLTALDIVRGTLKLRIGSDRDFVPGTFPPLIRSRLIPMLGCVVRLHGVVEYTRRRPTHIRVVAVEPPEGSSG